jgi:predicted dithiol-disulfide oxidoreductase (DUF899 family)
MTTHRIGTSEEHLAARLELLTAEKEHTRRGDEIARQRRDLPWVRVDTEYTFDTEDGPATLKDLFAGRSQLLVYHFMFGPEWTEGCPSCSFWADNFDRAVIHLRHRDVTMVCASRGPLDRIAAYKRRMGWSFPWISAGRNEFNYDFAVSVAGLPAGTSIEDMRSRSVEPDTTHLYNFIKPAWAAELPGLSAFALDDGVVYHTYSCYGRGLDAFNGAYQLLDRAPKGRDEDELPWPQAWVRRHDEYESAVATH